MSGREVGRSGWLVAFLASLLPTCSNQIPLGVKIHLTIDGGFGVELVVLSLISLRGTEDHLPSGRMEA